MPEAGPIVATDGVLLDHVPPVDASDNVALVPVQRALAPLIAAGMALTVIVIVAKHPELSV
jgi:hypothetical protein